MKLQRPDIPEVAFLIPVFNNQRGLNSTLESLEKEGSRFDTVVVDDGSATPLVAPSKIGQGKCYVIRCDRNRGISFALNVGLEFIVHQGYKWVARIDASDVAFPGRIEKQVAFLEANPEHAAVSCYVNFVKAEDGELLFCYQSPTEHAAIMRRMRFNNCLVHTGLMLRTAALVEMGFYCHSTPVMEDYELLLRLATRYKLAALPEVLAAAEYGMGGLSVARRGVQQRHRLKLQWRYFDASHLSSYIGVARTLVSMLTPHWAVLRAKQKGLLLK